MAKLLEGLVFPAIKSGIKDHVEKESQVLQQIEGANVSSDDDDNRILTLIEDNLLEYSKTRSSYGEEEMTLALSGITNSCAFCNYLFNYTDIIIQKCSRWFFY